MFVRKHAAPGLPWLIGLALIALPMAAHPARAAEIIPFAGVTGPPHVDNSNVKAFGGVAFRGDVLTPYLKDEISVSYRSESLLGGLERRHMWPVTASLWLQPIPALYGGAGVGWYNTTYTYDDVRFPGVPNETKQQFGIHVGGGLRVPLSPVAALDLNGRYVMLRDQQSVLIPQHFDPNFWDASLGLALHF